MSVTTQCLHCKYFIGENSWDERGLGSSVEIHPTFVKFANGETIARYLHWDNGEEHDHDAEPGLTLRDDGKNPWPRDLFPYDYETDEDYQERRRREFGGVVSNNALNHETVI